MAEPIKRSVQLKSKVAAKPPAANHDEPPPPGPPKQDWTEGLSPGAIRSRRFCEKLRADPIKLAAYKESDRERAKKYRKCMTQEEKADAAVASAERTRKCREQKKEKGLPLNNKKPKPSTRTALQEQREKERVRKAQYRAKQNGYQKSWVNRKRREQYAAKKQAQHQEVMGTPEQQQAREMEQNVQGSGYQNSSTKRKAVAKALAVLPASPSKFAEVVSHLTDIKSPRKRKALEDKGIHHPASRKKLVLMEDVTKAFTTTLMESRTCRNKRATRRRQILGGIFARYVKYRGCASHVKSFGTTRRFLKKCKDAAGDEMRRKKRKDAVPEMIVAKVLEFFERGDIARCDPCQSSVSAKTGESKRFMEKTLKEAYHQYITINPHHKISFSKFAKLKPKSTKATHHNKFKTCLCEYCLKAELLIKAINKFLAQNGYRELTISNKNGALELTLCPKTDDFHDVACIERTCQNCSPAGLQHYLQPVLEEHAEAVTEWEVSSLATEEYRDSSGNLKTVRKWKPVTKRGSFHELVTGLQDELKVLSLHTFNANWQQKQFDSLKVNLPEGWLLTVSDFGQNFTCHHQDEIQGAHWSRSEVTIHPVVLYYTVAGATVMESYVFLSNDHKHDAHATHSFEVKVVQDLVRRGLAFQKVLHFSDGCASQYKGKTTFVDLSFAEEDTGIHTERHYFGSRHGKGPCDAVIGTVKKCANLAVKRRAAVISDAFTMFQWAEAHLTNTNNKRRFVYVAQGDINRDRPDRTGDAIKTLPGTRSLHAVRGQAPYQISWRKRSCFCTGCRSQVERCMNNKACGPWTTFELRKRMGQRVPVHTEEPLAGTSDPPMELAEDQNILPPTVLAASDSCIQTSTLQDSLEVREVDGTSGFKTNMCVMVDYSDRPYPGIILRTDPDDTLVINFLRPHERKRGVYVYPDPPDIQNVQPCFIRKDNVDLEPLSSTCREWKVVSK